MLTNYKKWLKDAYRRHYAIGAFNVSNLEMCQAVIEAAEEMKSPVIIQTSEKAIDYAGLDEISLIMKSLAKKVKVPVMINLDHGRRLKTVKACLKAGYTAVMLDGSSYSFAKNIRLTKKTVLLAKHYGASTEGELGALAGIEDYVKAKEILMTDPDQAKNFIKKTSVDALAVSIGNAHGIPMPHEKFDLVRLKKISQATKGTPLVLHGASSTAPGKIRRAIRLGIAKINIDTDLRLAFSAELRRMLAKDKKNFDPRTVLAFSREAVKRAVKQKMKIFGSVNKSD